MSITSRISSMEEHVTNAYDELQGLGADLTNVNKNIENISMVLDDIYDSMPQVSGEGTSLTLDDTRVGKIKSTLKGNTEQTQYTGINLFNANAPSKTQVGVTVTNNGDGTFSISGTATANLSIPLTTTIGQPLTGGQPYTVAMEILSNGGSDGSLTVEILKNGTPQYNFFAISPQTTTGMKVQVSTPSEDATIRGIAYYCGSGAVVNNLKIRPYLVKGSYTTSTIPPYEPYVGGIPSPNPNYPQDIHVVSGDNKINVVGKNLLPISTLATQTKNGITFTNNNNGSYTFNGTASAYTTFVLNNNLSFNGNYTYVMRDTATSGFVMYLQNSSGQGIGQATTHTTIDNSIGIMVIGINNGVSLNNVTINPYVYKGAYDSTIEYEPYQGNTYNIDLPVENLCNGINQNVYLNNSANRCGIASDNSGLYIPVNGGNYTISTTSTQARYRVACSNGVPPSEGSLGAYNGQNKDNTSSSITIDTTGYTYLIVNATDLTKIQIEKGSKTNSYTPYGTTPIELCKIGDYQDYFYKDSGKWYLHKEIGKVVLTPINVDSYISVTQGSLFRTIIAESISGTIPYSNYYTGISNSSLRADGKFYFNYNASGNRNVFDFIDNRFTNVDDFKTFLTNNNVEVLFPIPTPTNTEITYQPLIDQLNLLEKAMSKDGQTNISQVNNDLPFKITASALKEWSV